MNLIRVMLLATCLIAQQVSADTVTVAVASNFADAMQEIAAAFEADTNHKIQLAFGSSGKFFAQISNGAPFEVFFSADQEKTEMLEANDLTVSGSRFTYAIGALALWSAKTGTAEHLIQQLKFGQFNKLALANPRLAPYGEAAVETLAALNLLETTRLHWVEGENISQTYQFVATGNADLGFVALAQIIDEGKIKFGTAWIVPSNLHKPIRQDAVLLNRGKNNSAALAFLKFVRGAKAKAIIEAKGYQTEEG